MGRTGRRRWRPRAVMAAVAIAASTAGVLALSSAPASAAEVFRNPAKIPLPLGAKPSPSTVEVSGMTGKVTEVAVTLHNVRGKALGGVDFLLVAPNGESSLVMSDACGGENPLPRLTLLISDQAPAPMPRSGTCGQVLYRPTDYDGLSYDAFAAGAPTHPFVTSLSRFVGIDPNGTWRLYANNGSSHAAEVESGWSLSLQTAQPVFSYPQVKTVSGLDRIITDVNVSLAGLYHGRPDEIDMLLVGPQGQQTMLMSDACAGTPAIHQGWIWDDNAPPMERTNCKQLRVAPTNYGDTLDYLPWPAPTSLERKDAPLHTFNHTDPNGEWRLFIWDEDDTVERFRPVATSNFNLDITARPPAKAGFAAAKFTVNEGKTLRAKIVREEADGGLGPATLRVTTAPGTATPGTDYRAVPLTVEFAKGEKEKVVELETVPDQQVEGNETYTIQISNATGDVQGGTQKTAKVTIRDVAPDLTAPAITDVSLTPAQFVPIDKSTKGHPARGTTVSYHLSEKATTATLEIQRVDPGPKGATVGTIAGKGRAGVNEVGFAGKPGGQLLTPGKYRVVVTAVDAAGNRGKAKPVAFHILG